MRYNKLGKSGIIVSEIAFGSLVAGPLQAGLSVDRAAAVMRHAFGRGINYVDTAELYRTYPHIRAAIRGLDGIVISSKTYAYTRELAKKAVDEARLELDRDMVDIFMLHEQESIYTVAGHRDALDYLFECREKGIIRAVGISTHHVAGVYAALETEGIDVVHPLINKGGIGIVDGTRQDMELAIGAAKEAGLGIIGMKALAGGNLHRDAASALEYAFSLKSVDTFAIGMQSEDEVDANLHFLEHGNFPEWYGARLGEREKRLLIEDWCTGCGRCAENCPQSALSVASGSAVCSAGSCVLCGYCSAYCPEMAIKIV